MAGACDSGNRQKHLIRNRLITRNHSAPDGVCASDRRAVCAGGGQEYHDNINLNLNTMNIRAINETLIEVSSDNGYVLRLKGEEQSSIRKVVINQDRLNDWEEIPLADIFPYTKEEYKAEVIRLIREKYDNNDETAILRKMLQSKPEERYIDEYENYNSFVEDCKLKAKETLWQRNSN